MRLDDSFNSIVNAGLEWYPLGADTLTTHLPMARAFCTSANQMSSDLKICLKSNSQNSTPSSQWVQIVADFMVTLNQP